MEDQNTTTANEPKAQTNGQKETILLASQEETREIKSLYERKMLLVQQMGLLSHEILVKEEEYDKLLEAKEKDLQQKREQHKKCNQKMVATGEVFDARLREVSTKLGIPPNVMVGIDFATGRVKPV